MERWPPWALLSSFLKQKSFSGLLPFIFFFTMSLTLRITILHWDSGACAYVTTQQKQEVLPNSTYPCCVQGCCIFFIPLWSSDIPIKLIFVSNFKSLLWIIFRILPFSTELCAVVTTNVYYALILCEMLHQLLLCVVWILKLP